MKKTLKSEGKVNIKHHKPISEEDIQNLYSGYLRQNDTDNVVLQHKVYFDLAYHFGPSGR